MDMLYSLSMGLHVRIYGDNGATISSTDMFNFLGTADLLTEVSANGALKHLHHEGKHRPGQGSIPSALGLFITNERVLCLYFQELGMV